MSIVIEWGNAGLTLRLEIVDGRVRLVNLGPAAGLGPDVPFGIALNPVQLQFAGDELPQGSRHVALGASARLLYESHEVADDDRSSVLLLRQRDHAGDVLVETRWQTLGDIAVLRSTTTIVNEGSGELVLEYVSSLAYNGFLRFAREGWERDATLAIPHNSFFSEFQWRVHSLPELGILDVGFSETGSHSTKKRVSVGSTGTNPTAEFLPMGAISDAGLGITWAWQIEHNGSWQWEVGDHLTGIYLTAGGPNDQEHHWHRRLSAGEAFTSVPAAIAVVSGGLTEAFVPLTDYRRAIRRPNLDDRELPVVFNDYMNCLVAEPSDAALRPVIAAAAAAGSEIFCVDAGWYSDEPGWWSTVGEWTESSARFPEGFARVFDRIRAAGMVPGLWIEPEVVGTGSPIADTLPDSAFFTRNGKRVDGAGRYQLDFRSPVVIERMTSIIDRLVGDYGLGYLKFDYNINAGVGTDLDADSAGSGLLESNRAYLSWVDSLFDRFPGIVIEACASGGGRLDYGTLARHSIASTSDQTDHLLSVPIAAAAPTALTPEQAAIWVYPQRDFTDDEFDLSIVNGLLGRPQLSGRIWELSATQLDRLAGAVALYKGYRRDIPSSSPFWPLGLPLWTDPWIAQGIRTPLESYLSVWRRGGEESIELTLGSLAGTGVIPEVVFPPDAVTALSWDGASGVLSLGLADAPSARVIRFSRRG